ncbi:MAG: Phosphoprotein phosphatase [Schlesneria sp.]|nr:Phosphoprotein phosphatase [Schlesneria sp.]
MFWEQQVRYAALTDVGFRRQNNQDACVVQLAPDAETWQQRGHLFVVADGMGGHAVGELASKIAVDTIPHAFDKLRQLNAKDALWAAIEAANAAIYDRGMQNKEFLRMGTTCTSLLLCPQGAIVGHVGDSRVYRVRNRLIDQLSCDHSLVWELIQQRKVHPRDAERMCPRNVITRSLGPEQAVQVDMEGPFPVLPGDTFVLCSDGLCGLLSDSEIGMIAGELPVTEASRLLVHLANLRGGHDNTTVIVIRAGEIPEGAQNSDPVIATRETGDAGWWGFIAICMIAMLFLTGLGLVSLNPLQRPAGAGLMITSALGLIGWTVMSRRRKRTVETPRVQDPRSTIVWRPYRTASARVTEEFLQYLARMEGELQRAATDENWAIDWKSLEESYRKAADFLSKKRLSKSLLEFSHVFDLLMVGVHTHRKQIQHETRWGKGANPGVKSRPT